MINIFSTFCVCIEMCLFSLKGGARALLNELDRGQRRDYDSLVKVLNNRYGSAD
jgi:hypothetical protein